MAPKVKLLKKKKKKTVIRYLSKPSGPCVTWMKFIAVMLAASLLLWQLIERIQGYIENPVVVTRKLNYLPEIPFPGLILCNQQPLRYSSMRNSSIGHVIDHYLSPLADEKNTKNRVNEIDFREFYANASQPAEDFIIECAWRGGRIDNCSHADFEMVTSDLGLCYRLNLNTSEWPNATAAGPADSFHVILNVDAVDTYKESTRSKSLGALLALFPFDNPTPLVSDISVSIPLRFEANIAIRSEFTERLPKSKKGQCDPDAELLLFQSYTTAGCLAENKFMRAVNACGCLPRNFPRYRQEDGEKYENVSTYLSQLLPCNVGQQYDCVERISWSKDGSSQNITGPSCPDACNYHRYSTSTSYGAISGKQLRDALPNEKRRAIEKNYIRAINARHNMERWAGIPSENYYRENFVILNIYFQELVHETIVQHLTYDGWEYAVDIAATIGIILGFLLSTMGEVVTNWIWLCRKVKGKPEDTDESESEAEEGNGDNADAESGNGQYVRKRVDERWPDHEAEAM